MEQAWNAILARYGQTVTVKRGAEQQKGKALIQPVPDRDRDQERQSPLGAGRQDRFLYLGPENRPLDTDTIVECQGKDYRVQMAHRAGAGVCPHWWAVLYPREEVPL